MCIRDREYADLPRVFHNNSLCKIWGANRVHYGQLENSECWNGRIVYRMWCLSLVCHELWWTKTVHLMYGFALLFIESCGLKLWHERKIAGYLTSFSCYPHSIQIVDPNLIWKRNYWEVGKKNHRSGLHFDVLYYLCHICRSSFVTSILLNYWLAWRIELSA